LPGGPEHLSASEALAAFYAREGLPADGGSRARRWRIALGPLSIPMPNFAWRSKALPVHDLHHLLTGYPCTPTGEFEMAAWEFAAGRYPHACATAFCLPLVGMGALLAPRRTYAAFVRGRASRTLYAQGLSTQVLQSTLAQLQRDAVPAHDGRAGRGDSTAYAALVGVSLAWTLAPVALLAAVLRWL
jgi:hypothetical protein